MKLIELPKSPYWGANLHVGFYPDGKKRYSPRSSKVVRDPSRVNERGQREDKAEALAILTALQNVANQAMASESEVIVRKDFEEMVAGVLRAVGKRVVSAAPAWDSFSREVLDRHCRDLSPATARSYWSKKSGFDEWLGRHDRLSPASSVADFRLADIQAFYDSWIEDGGNSTTINGVIQGISLVFERAVVSEFISKNPCHGIVKRDSVSVSKKPFTLAELSAITAAVAKHREEIEFADEWAIAIKFAVFTGARLSDCIKLEWSNFSDEFRRVRFLPKKKTRLHNLKKVDATVEMILPEFLARELSLARNASTSPMVTPSLLVIEAGKKGLGPRFRGIMDLAGIKYTWIPGKGPKAIAQASHGFHSFRHTAKTFLEAGGVSRETNNRITGHEDPAVAARYIHADPVAIFRECQPVFALFQEALEQCS